MTNNQRKQLADLYKAREREMAISAAEALLDGLERGLALSEADLRAEMTEMRDYLREAKAAGWSSVNDVVLPSERDLAAGEDG